MRRLLPWLRYRPIRHLVKLPCQLVRERDFRLVGDRIVNLSSSGLLVTPADPVLTGERLLLSFQWPGSDWVDAEVRVARVMHGRRPTEFGRALGLEFVSIEPQMRRLLARELERLPVVPPSWRPGRRNTRAATRRLIATSSRPSAAFA